MTLWQMKFRPTLSPISKRRCGVFGSRFSTIRPQQVAHKIRLGGNRGIHPPDVPAAGGPGAGPQPALLPQPAAAPITAIEKEHAEAIVKFTREFFHHVYVVPKQLDKYDFSKPKAAKP